jgi:hypothetical protein
MPVRPGAQNSAPSVNGPQRVKYGPPGNHTLAPAASKRGYVVRLVHTGKKRGERAGYGSRTRLAALGRLCTADMPIPQNTGHFTRRIGDCKHVREVRTYAVFHRTKRWRGSLISGATGSGTPEPVRPLRCQSRSFPAGCTGSEYGTRGTRVHGLRHVVPG